MYRGEPIAVISPQLMKQLQYLLANTPYNLLGRIAVGKETAVGGHVGIGGLPAQASIAFHQQTGGARLRRADSGGNACGAAANHHHIIALDFLH